MIDVMKQALEALLNYPMTEGKAITALRQAIEQAEKPPIYVERATTNYEDGWEEGFKAGTQKEKESTPSNADPRVLLNSNVNITKNIENRLCDIERRLAKIETQAIEQAEKDKTLQEISDIGQEIEPWDTSDMAHRSGGLSVEQKPVAWIYEGNLHIFDPTDWAIEPESVQPLYTAPPQAEKQEPVANRSDCGHKEFMPLCQMCQAMGTQAHSYAAPVKREWVGLTDEDIEEGAKQSWVDEQAFQSAVWWAESKLKEKNNAV